MTNKIIKLLLIFFFIFTQWSSSYSDNYFQSGKNYLSRGDYNQAKDMFYQEVRRNPSSADAPYALYEYAKLSNSISHTLLSLNKIVKQYPDFPLLDRVLDEIATIYYINGDYTKSYHYYHQLFKQHSPSSLWSKSLYYMTRILILKKEFGRARSLIKSNISLAGKDSYGLLTLNLLGESFYHERQFSMSISFYEKLLRSHPEKNILPIIYFHLGRSYLKIGNRTTAYEQLNKLIRFFPKSIESAYARNIMRQLPSHKASGIRSASVRWTEQEISYYLQLGYFSKRRNARNLKLRVQRFAIPCSIVLKSSRGKSRYILVAGPYRTKNEAMSSSQMLSQKGIKSILFIK